MRGTTNAEMSTVFSCTRPKLVEIGKLCTGNNHVCMGIANPLQFSLAVFTCILRKHPGFVIIIGTVAIIINTISD